MTQIGPSGGLGETCANAINNQVQIVGWVYAQVQGYAVLVENGTGTSLGTLGGGSVAYAINDNGQVVGTSFSGTGSERATLWTVTP